MLKSDALNIFQLLELSEGTGRALEFGGDRCCSAIENFECEKWRNIHENSRSMHFRPRYIHTKDGKRRTELGSGQTLLPSVYVHLRQDNLRHCCSRTSHNSTYDAFPLFGGRAMDEKLLKLFSLPMEKPTQRRFGVDIPEELQFVVRQQSTESGIFLRWCNARC